VARPDTILAWYRKLVASKFDGSEARRGLNRPRITREIEQLIVRIAEENRSWGHDRIARALPNLRYKACDQTIGNVLQRHGLPPAPEHKRTTTWPSFPRPGPQLHQLAYVVSRAYCGAISHNSIPEG
jgi:putative transposase